ncbi:DUF4936 family protein [Herbaspirillum sp. NPDC101397]|uniref:DUF4936 family protein n=1 Tax=Herbaspirillum sp. NPDC101397 TaxID=3364006 RepID=UPI00383A34C8
MDLYVYYRVPVGKSEQLEQQAAALQARLSQQHQVATELKRRPQDKDGLHTWMEVYLDTPEGFETILEEAITSSGLPALIDGPRHIEYFLDFSPCA